MRNDNIFSYLLLTTGYTLVLLVMAMEVATSVYVLKPDSLVLFPCLPATFDYKPMRRWLSCVSCFE